MQIIPAGREEWRQIRSAGFDGLRVASATGTSDRSSLSQLIRPMPARIAARREIPLKALAYIGDEVNDLEAMAPVGLWACPADAVAEAKASIVCAAHGGEGAFWEPPEISSWRPAARLSRADLAWLPRYVGRGTSRRNLRPRARYFLFLGTGAPGVFAELTPKGDAGTAGFFGCLGFLTSRLLRFWPLAIEVLLKRHV
jgi:hypothetical protein